MQYFHLIIIYVQLSTWCYKVQSLESFERGLIPGRLTTNCTCGKVNVDVRRIIGGTEASRNEWPMMAAIIKKEHPIEIGKFLCGGTIITHRHILTAAHCLYNEMDEPFKTDEIGVALGAHQISSVKMVRTPEKLVIHRDYDIYTLKFDLAIIVLPAFQFTKTILPVCLPTVKVSHPGRKFKLLGWGFKTLDGPHSDTLIEATVTGMTHKECKQHFKANPEISPYEYGVRHQICTLEDGKTPCEGDSGGPVLWLDPRTNRYVQIGTVSYGATGCANLAEVSSDIFYFIPWIQSVISDTYPEEKTCARVDQT